MEIRAALPEDIDQMMDVLAQGRTAIGLLGIDQWQNGYPTRDVIEADIARGESYIAQAADGSIAATAMISLAGEEDYATIDGAWLTESGPESPCYVVVHRIATAADHVGKGAASRLFAHAEEIGRAAGRRSFRIDTHEGNTRMRSLLEKRGFSYCGDIYLSRTTEGTAKRVAYEKLL